MRLISIITLFALALWPRQSPTTPVPSAVIVAYGPIQPASGWLLTRDQLFLTIDEGHTWQDVAPPLADGRFLAADFLASGRGWAVASRQPTPDQSVVALARTTDFGVSWRWTPLSLDSPADPDPATAELLLAFDNATEGKLVLHYASSSNFERWSEWQTRDGGETWTRTARSDAPANPSSLPRNNAVFLPDRQTGWSLERAGRCSSNGRDRKCAQDLTLRVTHDGGQGWRELALPAEVNGTREWTVAEGVADAAGAASSSRTTISGGQGFDKCEIATLDQLRTWRATSPYSAVNLYIGGSARACSNAALSEDYVSQISAIGWTFIPTWVGPQAPCTTFRSRMSSDPATAYSQGLDEAGAAAGVLASLGLSDSDGTGSVAYYDIEYFSASNAWCNEAVRAFMTGWTQGLHSAGHSAGVYGTGSALSLLASLSQPPDAVWAAHWIYDSYSNEATVWNVYAIDDDVWADHQRLRQYAGGHNETWGDLTMNIDSSVLDGPVAVVPFIPKARLYLPMLAGQ